MKCDWCGKYFPADAKCVSFGAVEAKYDDDGENWKDFDNKESVSQSPADFTNEQWEQMKADSGLDDLQLKQLLHQGSVEIAMIVCTQCQDEALEREQKEPK